MTRNAVVVAACLSLLVLAIWTHPPISGPQTAPKIGRVIKDFGQIGRALDRWYDLHGTLPDSYDALLTFTEKTGSSLPIIDVWGSRYHYVMQQDGTPLLSSAGPDRLLGTKDDIVAYDLFADLVKSPAPTLHDRFGQPTNGGARQRENGLHVNSGPGDRPFQDAESE